MKKLSLLLLTVLIAASSMFAQRTVRGTVMDEKGAPLPGATVVIKENPTVGTITDRDGKFSLSVDVSVKSLVASFIGYTTQEVELGASNELKITLLPGVMLEDIVVTSLGVPKEKKSLGYAVQDLQGEEIAKAKETNIINSLAGKIAGVQITNSSGAVGSSSRIVIRGANSLKSNSQPLFVVDGVPFLNTEFSGDGTNGVNRGNGSIDINPDDIENVTVLKGPNAAALYGSLAANGVVLITTKSGALTGKPYRKGLGIELNNSTTFENPLRLPSYQNGYGQGSGGEFLYVDGANGGINDGVDESWGPKLDAGLLIPQYNSPVVDGVRQPTPWVSSPNNVKDFLETGLTTTTNLALSGASAFGNFRLAFTNMNQKGMVPNTDYHKNTVSIGASANPTKKLNISATANYVLTNSNNMPGYGYDAQNVVQQILWAARQVYYPDLKNYKNADGSKYNWNYNYHNNPYFTLYENTNKLNRDRIYGNAKIQYEFTKSFSAFVRAGTDGYNNFNSQRADWGDIDNAYGYYWEDLSTLRQTVLDFLFMYNKKITDNLGFELSAGGSRTDKKYHKTFGAADELAVQGLYNINNSKVAIRSNNRSEQKRLNSLYFAGKFAFKNALYLDFTGRNDWSSTLPKDNNSYFYPSVQGSWVITEMLDLNYNLISFAKVRASWAQVGSDTDPYNLAPVLSLGDGWNASTKYLNQFVPNSLPNDQLEPELTSSFEVGAELRFLKNRLSLDVTYYNSNTSNQIINIPVSAASGYSTKYINAGKITNNGFEVTLGIMPFKSEKGFNWNINLNYGKNNNEVVELAPGVEQFELGTYWDLKVMAIPGQPFGSLYGADFLRDPDGNIVHRAGVPVKGELKILGNYQPDWTGGIANEFSIGKLSASVLVDARMGGELYTMTNAWGRYAGALEETLIGREGGIIGDGVKEVIGADGSISYVENDIVVTAEEYNHSAFSNSIPAGSVFDASYVKLREVRLGYTFDKLGNLPINEISISLIGRNLALLYSNVPHIDPETSFNLSNAQGLEFGQIPSSRAFGFNVGVKF